jgi:hypothetical protein
MLQMLGYLRQLKQMVVMGSSREWLTSLAAIASARTVLETRMASDAGTTVAAALVSS